MTHDAGPRPQDDAHEDESFKFEIGSFVRFVGYAKTYEILDRRWDTYHGAQYKVAFRGKTWWNESQFESA